MLLFGMKPPFSPEHFLGMATPHISSDDIVFLKIAVLPESGCLAQPTLNKWFAFDTALRNELVRIRATRRKRNHAHIRGDGYTDPSIAVMAIKAHRGTSILEGERMLDEDRWHALDNLEVGRYFDIDSLIIYMIKLSILERWERVRTADIPQLIEETLHGEPA